jgi:hypothetical protein
MTVLSKICKSITCGTLALLVSYVTLGAIVQPATLVPTSQEADAMALRSEGSATVGKLI